MGVASRSRIPGFANPNTVTDGSAGDAATDAFAGPHADRLSDADGFPAMSTPVAFPNTGDAPLYDGHAGMPPIIVAGLSPS